MFGDLTKAAESLNAIMEDGEGGAQEVSVDLEIQVTEDAVEPVEEAIEADDEVEATTDTVEEMLGQIERMEHAEAVVREFGWSRAVAMLVDPNGDMAAVVPSMPANENLDIAGSPNSAETVIALEGFKETMSKFWQWIKDMAKKVGAAIMTFFRTIGNLFRSYESQGARLAKAMKGVTLDTKKAEEKSVKIMTHGDWTAEAQGYNTGAKMIGTLVSDLRKIQVETGTNVQLPPATSNAFLKIENGKASLTPEATKKLEGSEMKVSASGWTPQFFTTNQIANVKRSSDALLTVCKEVEAAAKKIEAVAVKSEKDSEAKEDRKKAAREYMKRLNLITQVARILGKIGAKLCKQYMKAGYAVYACKAGKSE